MINDDTHIEIAALRNISKNYDRQGNGTAALKQVSFKALPGELVLLLGPSGSGKTTFLTLLAGFQKPSAGQVFLFGRNIAEYSSSELQYLRARHIGFVFQTFNLIGSMTVEENVKLVTRFAHMGKSVADKNANDLFARFGIDHLKASYPGTLSQGEKQRVAVARALVNGAELIIADEPTGSLSSSQGRQIVSCLKESVDKEQRTVVMVSHDERIKNLADRTLYIRDGVIEPSC
jgi:putative ABC transport system ATP-binding protein